MSMTGGHEREGLEGSYAGDKKEGGKCLRCLRWWEYVSPEFKTVLGLLAKFLARGRNSLLRYDPCSVLQGNLKYFKLSCKVTVLRVPGALWKEVQGKAWESTLLSQRVLQYA